jgi:hypothetical protein
MSRDATLAELLERQGQYHAEYRGGLSNHLPMALVALARMGAPADRLRLYARLYERRLELAPEGGKILSQERWSLSLGRRARYADFLATFQQAIAEKGWPQLLRDALPALMPGCGAAAFHPLIRLGYALEAEAPREVVIALAYWSARYLPLGGAPDTEARPFSDDPETLLSRLAADPAFSHHPDEDALIDAEMKRAAAAPEFEPVIGWLEIGPDSPRRLARAALRLYAATGDFTALHMLTGLQAARLALPYCANAKTALRWLWQALAAAYLSIGKPAFTDRRLPRTTAAPGWPAILKLAVAASDEHVIKLVYSCWVEDEAYADPLYRTVASSVVKSRMSEAR